MLSQTTSRRHLLQTSACGFGMLAFAGMASQVRAVSKTTDLAIPQPHFAARAKRVIFLFMHGGPSHVDLFDYKPQLQRDDGKELPFAAAPNISAVPKLMKSPWKFAQHGQSGLRVSELLPHLSKHVDDLCVIRSMHSRGQSHGQAVCMLHTGSDNFVRPSVGAWVSYGLGTENSSLPAFVSISPPTGHGGPRNYGPAFLPACHQATTIGKSGKLGDAKIANMNSDASSLEGQRRQLNLLQWLNRQHLERAVADPAIEGAIESFELAFRMQQTAPEVLNLEEEPKSIQDMYGVGEKTTDNFAKQCILARRMAEAGVRYIQVSTGNVWDQHGGLYDGHTKNCLAVDQPISALLTDLKQRGMLEDTLVVWGGEFGRTPIVQGSNGRDHNPQGFCMWMAGGGTKGGLAYGNTDDYGYYSVENRVHVHDLHATILHLLGINHLDLTYRYAGRDFRLTDIYGEVVHDVIA
ncbi:MAG: DUF1501 domain-containing protein [Planctomycetaceae bacterium]